MGDIVQPSSGVVSLEYLLRIIELSHLNPAIFRPKNVIRYKELPEGGMSLDNLAQ